MGDPFTAAIIITVAIAIFTERGKKEYGHTRDKAAAEFARAHPDWSPRKVMRHAKRRARGYWWDQISNGFPDYKRAHQESRELARAERAEAESGWLERRAELRKRTADALEKKDRLHREDAERQRARLDEVKNAPCVFCGAAHGEDCKADCPYRATHDANRANGGRSTVPPETGRTEPEHTTGPWPTGSTVPPEPSHAGGTVPPDRATTEPTEPVHRATPDRATEPRTDAPSEAQPYRTTPGPAFRSYDEMVAWANDQQCTHCGANGELRPGGRDENGDYNCDIHHATDCPDDPANMPGPTPDDLARKRAEKTTADNAATNGGKVTAPNVTGEVLGYEATVAEWDQTIAHLEADHARADNDVHVFEGLDQVYENRINGLRQEEADDETIDTVVHAREANETRISAAKASMEASAAHLEAAVTARARWIEGQGAVKDTADGVGARGNQALRD
jgi:hypothetical protein